MKKIGVVGPTYEEMLHPWKIDSKIRKRAFEMKTKDPLHPINLYNITWRDKNDKIYYFTLPQELTGVKANIIVMYAKEFPTGSHKVGATYSVLAEKIVKNEVDPELDNLIWPSTGNYGVGGAWVSSRMNYNSTVLLPELMSKERFDLIAEYGATAIATPGCESNVKEIYDKSKELKAKDPEHVNILNQFDSFGNFRFHEYVTGNTMIELVKEEKIGNQRIAAIHLTVGSSGTIGCGDRVKREFPEVKIIAGEPVQCPTLSLNGYGGHDIQGIGDKHVTWIHNTMNTDAVVQIDEMDSKHFLHMLASDEGKDYLKTIMNPDDVDFMADKLGISGIANIIGAIKAAKHYDLGEGENIITIATDSLERYYSVMEQMDKDYGKMTTAEAKAIHERIFIYQEPSYFFDGDMNNRLRWHNLKYYTWIEQQGKTIEELNAQKYQDYWVKQAEQVFEFDELITQYRDANRKELREIMGI